MGSDLSHWVYNMVDVASKLLRLLDSGELILGYNKIQKENIWINQN